MDNIDREFGPIKRSKTKVSVQNIIKDGLENHDQVQALRKIKLFTKHMHQQKYVLEDLPSKVEEMEAGEDQEQFKSLKKHLLRKLNNRLSASKSTLPGFMQTSSLEIERILKQCIIQKESHSCIIVGPRANNKISIINYNLDILSEEHSKQFVVVRLNGYIHSENAAINSIATQLENELIRIRPDVEHPNFQLSQGSITEVFENVLKLLDSVAVQMGRTKTALSRSEKLTIVFIFDEIDQFAGPIRQTLLYNLFDMVEHARVPVCILGCTTKLNILDLLEKRVKSRFSQRLIYVLQVANRHDFKDAFKTSMLVTETSSYASTWNRTIDKLLLDNNSSLNHIITKCYETFRDLNILKHAAITMLSNIHSMKSLIDCLHSCKDMNNYISSQLSNSLLAKVCSLSDLQLAILLAASRIALKNEENLNFNLTYDEYTSLIKSMNYRIPTSDAKGLNVENTIKIWNKKDVKNGWETLIELELIVERGIIAIRQSAQSAFQATNHFSANGVMPYDLKMFQVSVTLQELRRAVPQSSMLYSWTQL